MALAGCSVKEDRSSCPCTVMIDFTQMDAVRHSAADVLAVTDGTPVLYETVPSERYGEQYSFRVKRVSTVVDISSGWPERNGAETGFTVREGEQFPELYLDTEFLATDRESVTVTADLHKVYCNVTIDVRSEGVYPYSLAVRGNVCGYDEEGNPVPGNFIYQLVPDEHGLCSVRIPRQSDASLILSITENEDVLREFALGEYIIKSGYDWTAEDLEDVEVVVDYTKVDVTFRVNDWQDTVAPLLRRRWRNW